MKKKRIVSALMAVAMCVSAMPVSVYAEENTTAEMSEFTQKFIDECLMNPDESEENRLIHNYYKSFFDSEYHKFLGITPDSHEPYYLNYGLKCDTIPEHRDIKCVQIIEWGNYTGMSGFNENPYITEEEFNDLSYSEQLVTAGKIFDETGKHITGMCSTELARSPYYVGENGKAYDWNGNEHDIFNGEVKNIYIQPYEFEYDNLYIYDGKSVYPYTDVYTDSLDNALRADFYKYIEDNNAQEVFYRTKGSEVNVYRTKDRGWFHYTEDLSDELIITDKDGNVIPNDPNLLQVNWIWHSFVYVYKTDNRYILEDEDGNRIVFSEYDDSEKNNFDDGNVADDFFKNHSLYESLKNENLSTAHVIETYVAETDKLINYDKMLIGDTNEDGSVSLADAVLIMQALSNPDDFSLTEQGRLNADFNGDGTITSADALEIQLFTIS